MVTETQSRVEPPSRPIRADGGSVRAAPPPHRTEMVKFSTDPEFVAKVRDVEAG